MKSNISSIDYSAAFLNAALQDEVYAVPPHGFLERFHPQLVGTKVMCRVLRALYGLKQSASCWHKTLCAAVKSLGFSQTMADPCTFVLCDSSGSFIGILAAHVDDLLISTRDSVAKSVTDSIATLFRSSAPVYSPEKFLHWTVLHLHDKIVLNASHCTRKLREVIGGPVFPVWYPLKNRLVPYTGVVDPAVKAEYQSLSGLGMYIAHVARPDICLAMSIFGSVASCPSAEHLQLLKRLIRYLIHTPDVGICFSRAPAVPIDQLLSAASDADWAGCPASRRSQSGVGLFLNGCLFDWRSTKQTITATSTQEAELNAMHAVTSPLRFFRELLVSMRLSQRPSVILVDNDPAIDAIVSTGMGKSKHIAVRVGLMRDLVEQSVCRLQWVDSKMQPMDICTKPLVGDAFNRACKLLGLCGFP